MCLPLIAIQSDQHAFCFGYTDNVAGVGNIRHRARAFHTDFYLHTDTDRNRLIQFGVNPLTDAQAGGVGNSLEMTEERSYYVIVHRIVRLYRYLTVGENLPLFIWQIVNHFINGDLVVRL